MNISSLRKPCKLFALFALTTLLLLPLWNELSQWFMMAVIALVNHANTWMGMPRQFQLGAVVGEEAVTPGVVAGIALIIVMPDRHILWKMTWIGLLILFFWLAQSVFLLIEMQVAYGDFFTHLSQIQQLHHESPIIMSPKLNSFLVTIAKSGQYWTSILIFLALLRYSSNPSFSR